MAKEFNLNERVVKFSTVAIKISQRFPKNPAANHIADQIGRSASSPALSYGEAQGAESPKDFIHKMKVALKELRETCNALKIAKQMCWLPEQEFEWVLDENDQLIAIFFSSIRTAQKNNGIDLDKKKGTTDPKSDDENDKDENTPSKNEEYPSEDI